MAIWQYYLKVIPKESVVRRYGFVPSKLEINHDGWAKRRQDLIDGNKSEIDFEDAQTINWWKDVSFDKEAAIASIDELVRRCDWMSSGTIGWKGDTRNNQDNDVYIHFGETGKVESFTFRTDLRNDSLDFLVGMLAVCQAHDWLVMDARGFLFEARYLDVYESMRRSNATRFLEDAERFFEDLSSGKIKPE